MDILIVDDEVVMRSLVALAVQRKGYSVTVAADSAQALEYLASHTPDMIILDVMMPQIDGITFCRRLRSRPATEQTPIIMFTALEDERTKQNALAAGANHYCHKLSMYDQLYELIHESLQHRQRRLCKQPVTSAEESIIQANQSKLH
jgi:DNA-binding response OmpR family regulator